MGIRKWHGLHLAKFEAIHFSRKAAFPNPEIILPSLPIANGTGKPKIIKPMAKKALMRWLGVHFDFRLFFSDHAEKMASKGRKAASGLSMLVKTTKEVEVVIMQKAVHACILPILTYGAPAWWPGHTQTNKQKQTIQNNMEGNFQKLEKAQNTTLCAIFPIWKTTPTAILQREAATPPIHYTFDYLYKLAALRMHKLEAQHPLRIITKAAYSSTSPSRLERLVLKK